MGNIPVIFFDSIIIDLPKERIFSRLGYIKSRTELNDKQKDTVKKCIEKAVSLINLRGAGARLPITKINASEVISTGNIIFKSKSLAGLLNGSQEILIMAATAGKKIVDAIAENSSGRDVTASVIFDAVASEMVDSSLSWIMDYFNRQLRRENKYLTARRFSAGYGDFLLDNQKVICDILEANKIGVTLTPEYILIPEKSVTALAGIKPILPNEPKNYK